MRRMSNNTFFRCDTLFSSIDDCGDCVGGTTLKQPCIKYSVIVTASPATGGTVTGGGSFVKNALQVITAAANTGYAFVGWTGSSSSSSAEYYFVVDGDKSFTANFHRNPCNNANNRANPLTNMALAPPVTNGWANIEGATYGNTRRRSDGTSIFHNGIDLDGAVGDPVYAQFGGTIGNVVSGQPNRTNDVYPEGYTGDRDGSGNRIYVNSNIDGSTVSNGYWHLQAGNPIGRNPRTGYYWQSGDTIHAGEIVGYIGITGNANPDVPHLHLTTSVGGTSTNPADYLNATVSTTSTAITTPCD